MSQVSLQGLLQDLLQVPLQVPLQGRHQALPPAHDQNQLQDQGLAQPRKKDTTTLLPDPLQGLPRYLLQDLLQVLHQALLQVLHQALLQDLHQDLPKDQPQDLPQDLRRKKDTTTLRHHLVQDPLQAHRQALLQDLLHDLLQVLLQVLLQDLLQDLRQDLRQDQHLVQRQMMGTTTPFRIDLLKRDVYNKLSAINQICIVPLKKS